MDMYHMFDSGEPQRMKNSVCVFELDPGMPYHSVALLSSCDTCELFLSAHTELQPLAVLKTALHAQSLLHKFLQTSAWPAAGFKHIVTLA